MTDSPRPQMLGKLTGLFLAAGMILSTMQATGAWMKISDA